MHEMEIVFIKTITIIYATCHIWTCKNDNDLIEKWQYISQFAGMKNWFLYVCWWRDLETGKICKKWENFSIFGKKKLEYA